MEESSFHLQDQVIQQSSPLLIPGETVPLELVAPPIESSPPVVQPDLVDPNKKGDNLIIGQLGQVGVTSMIKEPVGIGYSQLTRVERRARDADQVIVISFGDNISPEERRAQVENLRKRGYAPLSPRYILGAIAIAADEEGESLPHPECKTAKDVKSLPKSLQHQIQAAQKNFIERYASRLILERDSVNNIIRIYLRGKTDYDERIELTDKVYLYLTGTDELVEALYQNRFGIGVATRIMADFSEKNPRVLCILDSPKPNKSGPTIHIDGENSGQLHSTHADTIVSSSTPVSRTIGIYREIIRMSKLQVQRARIEELIAKGEIPLTEAFSPESWPRHPLMERVKNLSWEIILEEVRRSGVLCDLHDIRYQTLFRLATYPVSELFEDGYVLEEQLWRAGVYESWKNIPAISPNLLDKFQLKEGLVRAAIREQLVIIQDRLSRSKLPLDQILIPRGIFAEQGWQMTKQKGEIILVNIYTKETRSVVFGPVGRDIAEAYHGDLHYIHTPRANGPTYGLYLAGMDLPFSVLAMEPIDRSYKKNVLLALGYDPDKCIDFTRLYSFPGVPKNTSSAVLELGCRMLEREYPYVDAALSAFMPTYAGGKSMLAGGFDRPVIIKSNVQAFQSRQIGGVVVWEHVTSRRQIPGAPTIRSQFPMFPTVELFRPLKGPRFSPLEGTKGRMFIID